MRGKLFLDFRLDLDSGITPADAGKTCNLIAIQLLS